MKHFDQNSILYEDDHILVVVKPHNLPIQPTRGQTLNLLNLIEDFLEFHRGIEDPYIGLVHRLDQPTGGIVVFTKDPKTTTRFNQLVKNKEVQKTYLALCKGRFSKTSGTLKHYLIADAKTNYVTCHTHELPHSKEAILTYQVIDEKKMGDEDFSLVEIQLDTGRQHQIRVQFKAIGHPLVGDHKYGFCNDDKDPMPQQADKTLMLWAYEMSFRLYGKAHHFRAIPTDPRLIQTN